MWLVGIDVGCTVFVGAGFLRFVQWMIFALWSLAEPLVEAFGFEVALLTDVMGRRRVCHLFDLHIVFVFGFHRFGKTLGHVVVDFKAWSRFR